ncbi:hypothetical protein L596_004129 [Steinernema carpocapsae]|uniref:Uncharacterized protein n=1 Tax=Steinernema carpocapsae TaxID=34508 RepID=A0A4U8UWE5_STECR|nr:hypothetical protein L596_004129 [Steinernema carpocapsae]
MTKPADRSPPISTYCPKIRSFLFASLRFIDHPHARSHTTRKIFAIFWAESPCAEENSEIISRVLKQRPTSSSVNLYLFFMVFAKLQLEPLLEAAFRRADKTTVRTVSSMCRSVVGHPSTAF